MLDEAGLFACCRSIGQTHDSFDWRDSRVDHASQGFVVRRRQRISRAWAVTSNYVRAKVDGTYWVPLDRYFTGNPDWGYLVLTGGAGELFNLQSRERIIDRFFLGGDNLRGFLDQGVGPHSVAYTECAGFGPPLYRARGTSTNAQGQCNDARLLSAAATAWAAT